MPTVTPSARSSRPNASSRCVRSPLEELGRAGSPASSLIDEFGELRLDAPEVVAILDRPAEAGARGFRSDRVGAQESECLGPVDRLRGPRQLDEIELSDAPHGPRHGAGERIRDARDPKPDDRRLALGVREVDPVEEAATLEVMTTTGGLTAVIVPSSGTVTE